MSNLSLLGIESDLHELFSAWQDAETPEQVEAAEVAIRACAEAQVRKVDGIRKYWRFLDQMEAAAKHEAATQLARAKLFESRRERLKAVVYEVMDRFGLKKLEGQTGGLLLKANGGKQAVEIHDESLIPYEYMLIDIRLPLSLWRSIQARMEEPLMARLIVAKCPQKTSPSSSLIAEALARNCEACRGTGEGDDYGTGRNGEALSRACRQCGGTGKQGVPGARLAPRGQHVEVR